MTVQISIPAMPADAVQNPVIQLFADRGQGESPARFGIAVRRYTLVCA